MSTDTELRQRFADLRTEVGKAVVGQDGAVTGLLIALLASGHVLLEGVPGVAKTLLVRTLSHALNARHQARAVHARPDAGRHHRLAGLRPEGGRVRVPRGAGVHEHPARRRDQPHAAEDPVGAARGDGGAAGLRRRRHPPAAGAVPGRRDHEPDRVRGHLHAARGAARPLPAQARARPARARRPRSRCSPARERLQPARPRRRPASTPVLDAKTLAAGAGGRRDGHRRAPTCSATRSTSRAAPGRARRSSSASARAARPRCSRRREAWAWLTGSDGRHARPRAGDGAAGDAPPHPAASGGRARGVSPDAVLRSIMQQVQVPI